MAFVADPSVDAGFGASAVVAVAGIDSALLRAHNKRRRIRPRKRHTRWRQILSFQRGRRRSKEFEIFAGLGEHIDGPGADDAVGGTRDDVVCVLGPDDVKGVDGVGMPG